MSWFILNFLILNLIQNVFDLIKHEAEFGLNIMSPIPLGNNRTADENLSKGLKLLWNSERSMMGNCGRSHCTGAVMSQKPADFFLTPSCSWSESQCSPTGRGRPTWFWFWWGFLPVKGEFLLGSLIATLITTNRNVFSLHSRLVHALDGGSDQTEVSVQSVGFLLRKRF